MKKLATIFVVLTMVVTVIGISGVASADDSRGWRQAVVSIEGGEDVILKGSEFRLSKDEKSKALTAVMNPEDYYGP